METSLEGLSLGEEDELGLEFDMEQHVHNEVNYDLCLVGRFLIDKNIRFNSMKERMAAVWRPGKGVFIKDLGKGRYLFQFYHKIDMLRVLNGGPWVFDNHMLILGVVKAGETLTKIPLNHVCFWVQIHDLPVGFMLEVVGQHLGNYIGSFVEYDAHNNDWAWRSYMRLKVNVDVRFPLKKEKKVRKLGGEWKVVKFKYEKLGTFCYLCGVLGHTDQFCEKNFQMEVDDGSCGWGWR